VLSGVVYMTKSRGPRTEPRGTPQAQMPNKVCNFVLIQAIM